MRVCASSCDCTIRMDDGTTQVDHILVSRFGVFVIETKHYAGWLVADEAGQNWTQVRFRARFKFQNPILQNARHVRAVRGLLDSLPPDAIKSLVVFTGDAEFKTEIPQGVITIGQLGEYHPQLAMDMPSRDAPGSPLKPLCPQQRTWSMLTIGVADNFSSLAR